MFYLYESSLDFHNQSTHLPHEPPGSSDQDNDEGQRDEDGEDGDHSVIVRHPRIMKTVWNRINNHNTKLTTRQG